MFVALDKFVALVWNDAELLYPAAYRQAAFRVALPALPQVTEEPFLHTLVFQFHAFGTQESVVAPPPTGVGPWGTFGQVKAPASGVGVIVG